MADLSRTIQIVFEAVDNTGTGIAALGKGVGDLADDLGAVTQPMADLTGKIIAADAAMLALGGAMIGWATGAASKFQIAQGEINTILGLAPDKMAKFSKDILDYGTTSTQTFTAINKGVYDATSAGVKYGDALGVLARAEKLAVAGKADLGDAIKLLVPTLNAYGLDMDKAGRFSDVFFTTVKLGVTTVPQLSAAMGQLTPTAAALGVPIETVGAALATLTSKGIGTEQATTGLKAALSNIVTPSEKAAAAADKLKISFGASAVETEGLEGLLKKLYTATGGNITEMGKFFGSTDALNTVLALTSGNSKLFTTNLEAMKTAAGATDAAYKIMAGTLENVNIKLGNAIEAVGIRLGTELLPKFTAISTALTGIFSGIGTGIDEKSFAVPIRIIQGFLDDIEGLLSAAAKNLPAALKGIKWTEFEASMTALSGAFDGLFDGVDLTSAAGLTKAIQTFIDIGSGVARVTGGIVDGLNPLFTAVGLVITGFNNLSPEMKTMMGYALGLGTSVNVLSGFIGTFSGIIGGAGGLVGKLQSLGTAAAAVAIAMGAFEVGKWIADFTGLAGVMDRWVENLNGVPTAAQPADAALGRMGTNLDAVAKAMGLSSISMKDFNAAADAGEIIFNDVTGQWEKAATAGGDLATSTGKLLDVEKDLNPALKDQYTAMGLAADGTKKLGTETSAVVKDAKYFDAVLRDVDKAFKDGKISQDEYAKATGIIKDEAVASGISLDKLAKSEAAAAKDAKDLAAESEKFALEWGKLLSAERIAVFEASADIQVAQIEADSKRAVAAMEMLGASFANTGEVLTDLIGLWVGLEGMDQSKIEGWIEREYAIREALAQAQIDMVNAEIRRLEAQTALLERGGVELKITADGMEEDLKAFMFQIIDRVRVSVAGSYEEFLLGCGA